MQHQKHTYIDTVATAVSRAHFLNEDRAPNTINECVVTTHQKQLTFYALIAGLVHQVWYQTILQSGAAIGGALSDYHPLGVWLPCSTIGALIGSIYYLTIPNPVQVYRMKQCCDVLIATGALLYIAIFACYKGQVSQMHCTIMGAIIILVNETARGYLMCLNFGLNTYFHGADRMTERMATANSIGAAAIGFLPWLLNFLFASGARMDHPSKCIFSIGVNYVFAALVCGVYRKIIAIKYGRTVSTLGNLYNVVHTEKRNMSEKQGPYTMNEFWQQLRPAVPATMAAGATMLFNHVVMMAIYPEVMPFGYQLSKQKVQRLLAVMTFIVPAIQYFGLRIEKKMKAERIRKKHYATASLLRALIVVPLCIYPYANPATSWVMRQSMWHFMIIMIIVTVSHACIMIMGVYCYMSNLPNNETKEFRSGLMAIYMSSGVLLGQILSLVLTRDHHNYA